MDGDGLMIISRPSTAENLKPGRYARIMSRQIRAPVLLKWDDHHLSQPPRPAWPKS
jgi:hypothetical protein